jgi:hypothetical protein
MKFLSVLALVLTLGQIAAANPTLHTYVKDFSDIITTQDFSEPNLYKHYGLDYCNPTDEEKFNIAFAKENLSRISQLTIRNDIEIQAGVVQRFQRLLSSAVTSPRVVAKGYDKKGEAFLISCNMTKATGTYGNTIRKIGNCTILNSAGSLIAQSPKVLVQVTTGYLHDQCPLD